MTPSKRKRPPRTGEGRPARTDDGPSTNFVLRLSGSERDTLRELAMRLGCSEAEAARVAIREAVHERFHDRADPECELCEEYETRRVQLLGACDRVIPQLSTAISEVVAESAARLRARKTKR